MENISRPQKGYVDETFVIQQTGHKDSFLQHIYSIDSVIKFTIEDAWPDWWMSFEDIIITPEAT